MGGPWGAYGGFFVERWCCQVALGAPGATWELFGSTIVQQQSRHKPPMALFVAPWGPMAPPRAHQKSWWVFRGVPRTLPRGPHTAPHPPTHPTPGSLRGDYRGASPSLRPRHDFLSKRGKAKTEFEGNAKAKKAEAKAKKRKRRRKRKAKKAQAKAKKRKRRRKPSLTRRTGRRIS